MKNKRKSYCFIVFILILAFFIIIFSKNTVEAAYNSIISLITTFIPSIFPFLVISNLIIESGCLNGAEARFNKILKLFKLPPAAAEALAVGLISGFPSGAISAASLYKRNRISKSSAERLMGVCNLPGPAFVISAVGVGIFNSLTTGFILYFAVIASSLISGIFFGFFEKIDEIPKKSAYFHPNTRGISLFTDAVKKAAVTMAFISAFIVFFAVIISIIKNIGLFSVIPSRFLPLLSGFFELTYGLRHISDASPFSLASAAAILSFSGLCVFMQTASAILDSKLDMKKYLIGKIISAVLAFIITYSIFYLLMPLDFYFL